MRNALTRYLLTAAAALFVVAGAQAQRDSMRTYTQARPLVYEDVWDLWPYSFLNDNGEPDGFNVDLIRMMMDELNIPYVIKLKPQEEAFRDLRDGKSDLMLGLAVGFHDEYGMYSKNAVTLFTQSVATPKKMPVAIKNFRDLSRNKVTVMDGSLCHHLMTDYGWGENALPDKDMREAIQQLSAKEEGQIVWNTLSLKWLIRRYQIDNVELTPVNMPHGEYKFMANNQQLLDLLDETYTKLYTADKLTPVQNKWFYPERQKQGLPAWMWYVLGITSVLLLIVSVYGISYMLQSRRLTKANDKLNRRLALILQTSHVRLWTYDVKTNRFAWRNDNGQVAYTYSMEEFSQRYSPEDFQKLHNALQRLAAHQQEDGDEAADITLNLRAKDTEDGDNELHDFYIVLSVLSRDKNGKPSVIIGTKKDVTDERSHERFDEERTLRYWSIFYTSIVGIMLFDKEGRLSNINPKACDMFECDPEEMLAEGVTISDILDTENLALTELDGFYATQFVDLDRIPAEQRKVKSIKRKGKLYNEYKLMTVDDDSGDLLGIFAICRDVTASISARDDEAESIKRVNEVKDVLNSFATSINMAIYGNSLRMARYSPSSHTLTIYSAVDQVQHALTQTRCMTLVNNRSKKIAMRLLNDMDEGTDKNIEATIGTTLRVKGGLQLELVFKLVPLKDKNGHVYEYFGLCRDCSELQSLKEQMAQQTAKVQEVEATKSSFVKNMVKEIRTPMDTVLMDVAQLDDKAAGENEPQLRARILENADYLLHLIDNILYLSRLEAHMVEINKRECNFAELFESQCMTGWMKFQNEQTRYLVENPYEQLVVDIDAENLGNAIGQLAANAAQHTKSGYVRARYEYLGRRLVITIDDTGDGIPATELEQLSSFVTGKTQSTKGLGLAITKELVRQMGGMLEISSEQGSGTTVYIMIPCHASVMKRKKVV